MNHELKKPSRQQRVDEKPWYKQFWPWFIIALPLTSVAASFTVLWIAISNPDYEMLNKDESLRLHKGLKAQPVEAPIQKQTPGRSDSDIN
jgi:hypothetical protein